MKAHRVNLLLLLSAILNFTTTTYGQLFGIPPVQGINLYRNQVPHQPVFANQYQQINGKLLDLYKQRHRNSVILQNINRRNRLNNNYQQSSMESLRQRGQTVRQNNEEKVVNPNLKLLQRFRVQNPGETAMQNGHIINNNLQSVLERLRQTQKDQNVGQNYGQHFDLLQRLKQQNRGQLMMHNVNQKFGSNSINNNPVTVLEPKELPRENFVVQNIGRNNGLNPSLGGLLEVMRQQNRGPFIMQNVNRSLALNSINNNPKARLELKQLPREQFVLRNVAKNNGLKPSLEILPVSLQRLPQHNNGQFLMQNVKQKMLNPENNYFNTLVEPLRLQHREKTMSRNIDQSNGLNFGNIEALKLTHPDQLLIESGKRLSEHKNSYLNSLLKQLKEHRNHVTINNQNPNKHRYPNNDLEIKTLEDQQNNKHKHGLKEIINQKNYVSLNDNNIPFDQQIDYANRNLLLNIFIEKYIPENIKRILYNARTKEEKEKVPMLLKNYKVITFAFANFLRYANPLAGYIKSLRIISENMKEKPKNDVVPVRIIQKEIENLSQVGVDESGFSIKKIGSNPGVLVEELKLKVDDSPENEEPLEKRPANNLNEETFIVPETNAETDIETDENENIVNQEDTRLNPPDHKMLRELNSEALHHTTTDSGPLENIEEDLTVLHSNEDAASSVIGLGHLKEGENDVQLDQNSNDNIENNNPLREDVVDVPKLVVDQNDDGNLIVNEPQRPEIESEESITKYIRDTDLKENQISTYRPNLMINTMLDEVFCQSLDTGEAIDIMQEVLYNVLGELNKMFRLDDAILNVTRHAISKTLYNKNLYSNKRCENDPYDLGTKK